MTSKAREVLEDCRFALSLLEDETDARKWRILWAASIALVRTVGHVLDKVDGADPAVKEAASTAFKRWKSTDPDHRIFREFIERERNHLLKEYRSDVHPSSEVSFAFEVAGSPLDAVAGLARHYTATLDRNIYRPMLDGPWEGDDARDVLEEATLWWEAQLSAIDAAVANGHSSDGSDP